MNWDRIKKYGDGQHENLIQSLNFASKYRFAGSLIEYVEELTLENAQKAVDQFNSAYPAVSRWSNRTSEIEAFEKWQNEQVTPIRGTTIEVRQSDDDETFAAIHVALLLSKTHRITPHQEEKQ